MYNFMDYTQDSCLDIFTPRSVRSDGWVEYRAGGNG
jgi:hypothetical protein